MVENRRVMMTKRLLKESIFELMKNKPLNKITIKELCENADANRQPVPFPVPGLYDPYLADDLFRKGFLRLHA